MFDIGNNEETGILACLHSSGASGRQWNALRGDVGERCTVLTPNLIGYGKTVFRHGEALSIGDEVAAIVRHIDAAGGRAHLVGHSYGGAVATHVALWHPERVASLTLYEPVLFSLLYRADRTSILAREIERVAHSITSQLDSIYGRWQGARDFINYWAGFDAWRRLEGHQQARFAGLMAKVAAEFRALVEVGTTAEALAGLCLPVRLYCGTATRQPARRIAEIFAESAPRAELVLVEGRGHMAPVTDAATINPLLVAPIVGRTAAKQAAVA